MPRMVIFIIITYRFFTINAIIFGNIFNMKLTESQLIEMIRESAIKVISEVNKEYDDITSINITDSKKSYNNESSSKKEGYKTLSQDIKNSMKKPLN